MKSFRVLCALLALGVGLTGCKGGVNPPDFTPELKGVTVSPDIGSVPAGRTFDFSGIGTFTNPPGSDSPTFQKGTSLDWSSSSEAFATIDSSGTAKGLAIGTVTITGHKKDFSDTATLNITAPVLESIAIQPANPSVAKGRPQSFTLLGTYSDGSTGAITSPVTWTSSDTNVATFATDTGATNIAQSVNEGTTTITVETQNAAVPAETIRGTTVLTVTGKLATGILSVTPNPISVALGRTQLFTANGTFTDGTTGAIPANEVNWTSSAAPNVATVDATGLASTNSIGTTTITATLKDPAGSPASAGATLTVTQPVLTSIVIQPADPSVPIGTTTELTALGIYTDSTTPRNITGQINCPAATPPVTGPAVVSWTSDDLAIATVAPPTGAKTEVTGVAVGTTAVHATSVNEECNPITAQTSIVVTNAVVVSLLRVEPSPSFVTVGLSVTFHAVGMFSDGTEMNLENSEVVWTSATPAVATITADGVATGVIQGQSTITATLAAAVTTPPGNDRDATSLLTVTDNECTTPLLAANNATATKSFTLLCVNGLTCSVTNPGFVIDNVPDNAAVISAMLGLLTSSASLTVQADPAGPLLPFAGGQDAGFRISRPAGLLVSAEILSQITLSTVDAAGKNVESSSTTIPLRLTLLGQGGNSDFALASFTPTLPFHGLRLTFGSGVASALTELDVSAACATATPPPVSPPAP